MEEDKTIHYRNIARKFIKRLYMKSPERINFKSPGHVAEEGIPDVLPAYGHDIGNYVARYGMGNFQIQFVLKLGSKLDFERLTKAVRLSVDAEPVLGCRFIEHDPPYWKRLSNIDNVEFCSMVETDNAEEAVNRFLESRLSMDHDPMVKVKLIRSAECDYIVVKLNHACTDGGGAKEYIHLLADIYTRLESENGSYKPVPSDRSRDDHEKIFAALGIKFPELDNSIVESVKTVWPFPWKPGSRKREVEPFVISRLPDGYVDLLSRYGKERGATVNDLILTAYYRAMFKLTKPPYGIPMDMGVTVDLRRYLPGNKADAIRNLTGGVVLSIARIMGEPFEGTLSRVVAAMNRKKNRNPGYQSATGAERAELMNFYQAVAYCRFMSQISDITSQFSFYCSPGLSNLGYISRSLLKFGQHTVIDAYIIPPVIKAPGILLVASSYNGVMTLAMGYYKGSISRRYIVKLLDKIRDELVGCCSAKEQPPLTKPD